MLATNNIEFEAASAPRRDDPTVSIHYIKRHTGTERLKDKALVAYVEALIAAHAFPPPLPCPVKGQGATTAVRLDSRWRRAAVDLWLDDQLPPATSASLDDRAAAEAADVMDARAAALGLRIVNGGQA